MNLSDANRLPCSQMWFMMKKGMENFNKGIKWAVERNSNLNFWFDTWINRGTVWQMIHGPLSREDSVGIGIS